MSDFSDLVTKRLPEGSPTTAALVDVTTLMGLCDFWLSQFLSEHTADDVLRMTEMVMEREREVLERRDFHK